MTHRERLEAKAERRREWADGRRAKASALRAANEPYRGDYAFATQPGHIPERARANRRDERAFEHSQVAAHHEGAAAGIESQLDRSIFSDDPDGIEALTARIAANETTRDRMKEVNRLYRKGDAAGLAALGLNLDTLKANLAAKGPYWGDKPFLSYEFTNIGASIRRDRERIEEIKRRAARTEAAEAAGGVTIQGDEWVRVTFAEKPDREVLDALRAAGFQWGAGSWTGKRAALPSGIGHTPAPVVTIGFAEDF